jgi:sec-independent protein translocase protein TatA
MAGIGVPELLIILAILLLVFGPKRLPGLGRQLGGGMRDFKDAITNKHAEAESEDAPAAAPARPALPEAATPPAVAPQPPPAEPVSGTPERDQTAPPPRA